MVWFRHHFALSRVDVATAGVLRVHVRMVFCYNTIRREITNSTSRNFAKKNHSDNEIARVRADVENAIPRQSHDVASAPASRRRVERDASSNASRRVRAARSYRERGLLFFVLDACGRVRRRAAKRARYPKVRCVFVISVAHARFFRSGGGRKRARAERARREARRKTRDRWPNARHHSVREKHRRDRLRSRHAPAAEATSRMGDVPVLLVYANPKAKPPPRHAAVRGGVSSAPDTRLPSSPAPLKKYLYLFAAIGLSIPPARGPSPRSTRVLSQSIFARKPRWISNPTP